MSAGSTGPMFDAIVALNVAARARAAEPARAVREAFSRREAFVAALAPSIERARAAGQIVSPGVLAIVCQGLISVEAGTPSPAETSPKGGES